MNGGAVNDARLVREREYHNRRFEHEVREAQWKYYAAISHGRAVYYARVANALAGKAGLELGCGLGSTSLQIGQVARSVTAIDLSEVAVDKAAGEAARIGLANATFRCMNAESLDFPEASFDVVFGKGIIHHLDLERAFRGIRRVLRPGGSVIFYEPLGHNPIINAYRDRTLESRTPDEHPLLRSDIELARRHFASVEVQVFGLLTLLGVPLRGSFITAPLLAALRALDKVVLALPGVRWLGWYALISMRA
jgi:SAM-dependent methyltransferase